MASSLSQFRDRFPEFSAIADSVITQALADALDLMNEIRWDTRLNTGQEFLAAHFVSISSASTGEPGSVGPLSGASTGPLSVSFAVPTALNQTDAFLASSRYGQRYLQLRNIVGKGALTA